MAAEIYLLFDEYNLNIQKMNIFIYLQMLPVNREDFTSM